MSKTRVMVVEDERIVAKALASCLAELGYFVNADCDTAEAALANIARVRPDVVLMDIGLVGAMDGVEAAVHIWNRFHIPVIFLTGDSEAATMARAQSAHPAGYITKPFDERTLEDAIERALMRRPENEESGG